MKIKKVDDKPMVIHTKEKAKIHAHEPKGAKIKGSNIYTVERGPKVHDAKANEMDKKASAKLMLQKSAGGKRTYRKSTIHQSEAISYGGATTAAAEAQGLDEAGKTVSFDELQPGDLIFYSFTSNGRYKNISHVAVYVGNGKVVEALNESLGVVYRDVASTGKIVVIGRP